MWASSSIQWGSVGEWVSGIGALLAVLTTFVVLRSQARSARRANARRLAFDLIPKNVDFGDPLGIECETVRIWQVICHNTSDESFFDIEVKVHVDGRTLRERVDPGGVHPLTLRPGQSEGFWIRDGETRFGYDADAMTARYRDVDGLVWEQGLRGSLTRVPWFNRR